MKRLMMPILVLLTAAVLALAGCGGGGGGGGGDVVNNDRDGDSIPNAEDSFPDDATRFTNYATVLLGRLTGGLFATAVAVNDANVIVGLSEDGTGAIKAVQWAVTGTTAGAPVQLNPIAGNTYSAAYGVDGVVVGESARGADFVAVQWAGSADPTELSLTGFAAPAAAYGISGNRIVGEATTAGGDTIAVLWSSAAPAAAPVSLGTLGGATSTAYAVAGTLVVGESVTADGDTRGAVWILSAAGVPAAPAALPPLAGHTASIALGINPGGEIVGESVSAAGEVHAVLWTLSAAGLPGAPVDFGVGSAAAISDSSRLAGSGGTPSQAAVWDIRNTTLGNSILSGAFSSSQAFGMNDGHLVVGLAGSQGFAAVPQ